MNTTANTLQTLSQARMIMQEAMSDLNSLYNDLGRISSRAVSTEDAAALETKAAALRTALDAQIAALSEEVFKHVERY